MVGLRRGLRHRHLHPCPLHHAAELEDDGRVRQSAADPEPELRRWRRVQRELHLRRLVRVVNVLPDVHGWHTVRRVLSSSSLFLSLSLSSLFCFLLVFAVVIV